MYLPPLSSAHLRGVRGRGFEGRGFREGGDLVYKPEESEEDKLKQFFVLFCFFVFGVFVRPLER